MSVHAISWALRQDLDDHLAARLLAVLADYADRAGSCWPAIATLAERVHASAVTVRRKLKELVARGLIRIRSARDEHGRQRSNRYHLSIGKSDRPQPEGAYAGGAKVEPPAQNLAGAGWHRQVSGGAEVELPETGAVGVEAPVLSGGAKMVPPDRSLAAEPAEPAEPFAGERFQPVEKGGALSELRQGPLSQLRQGGGYHSCDSLTCHKELTETSEERVSPLPDARARRVFLNAGWRPSPADLAHAGALGLTPRQVDEEATAFRDRALADGISFADVSAAWRRWLTSPCSILKKPRKANRNCVEVLDELIADLTAAEAGHGPPLLLADLRV